MKRRHQMPFGSELVAGGVSFRLWAPDAPTVILRLEGDAPTEVTMQADAEGWHRCTVAEARAGSRYRFRLPDGLMVPDPASRFNPDDVHGASEVIDPLAFDWPDEAWRGRPWEAVVLYELHLGTFSPEGDYQGVEARLDYLAELGITALEIMPVADFPGRHNWGYDGVLPYAPDRTYGRPEDFKQLIAAAHARGLMVILDVVYNHFGPEGNYLHTYASDFFNPRHHTPWGAAINFDGANSRTVREFFIHNALYWLEEFHLDGLRLDAIHAICDESAPNIIEALGAAVRSGPGREREVHLILENDRNESRYLRRDDSGRWRQATAQWNDDIHHAFHVIATRETDGYYAEYAGDPVACLARCLTEGFAFQGEPSLFRDGALRGEPSVDLPPLAFVNFLQTHDQIGNRAFGERLCHLAAPEALRAVTTILLLAPQPPLLFMGEEFASSRPFQFFCDFGPDLAKAVTEGRRREFARFERFADPAVRERIPDPSSPGTFGDCVLDWAEIHEPPHREMLDLYRQLLAIRHRIVVPRLLGLTGGAARAARPAPNVLHVGWQFEDGCSLEVLANLGDRAAPGIEPPRGETLFRSPAHDSSFRDRLPPWSVWWTLREPSPA